MSGSWVVPIIAGPRIRCMHMQKWQGICFCRFKCVFSFIPPQQIFVNFSWWCFGFSQVSLLYANVSPDDILLKQKLDILATSHPNLKVQMFQYVKAIAVLSKLLVWKQHYGLFVMTKKKNQVFYTVDNPSKNWRGGTGFISKDMVVKGLPDPSDDTLILVSVTSLLHHLNFHMLLLKSWYGIRIYIYRWGRAKAEKRNTKSRLQLV